MISERTSRALIATSGALLLLACQQQQAGGNALDADTRARLSLLEKEIAVLKARLDNLQRKAPEQPRTKLPTATEATSSAPAGYLLTGPRGSSYGGTKYPNRARCEAARDVLRKDLEQDPNPDPILSQPQIICVPL